MSALPAHYIFFLIFDRLTEYVLSSCLLSAVVGLWFLIHFFFLFVFSRECKITAPHRYLLAMFYLIFSLFIFVGLLACSVLLLMRRRPFPSRSLAGKSRLLTRLAFSSEFFFLSPFNLSFRSQSSCAFRRFNIYYIPYRFHLGIAHFRLEGTIPGTLIDHPSYKNVIRLSLSRSRWSKPIKAKKERSREIVYETQTATTKSLSSSAPAQARQKTAHNATQNVIKHEKQQTIYL